VNSVAFFYVMPGPGLTSRTMWISFHANNIVDECEAQTTWSR
jgi:hypothetical protein